MVKQLPDANDSLPKKLSPPVLLLWMQKSGLKAEFLSESVAAKRLDNIVWAGGVVCHGVIGSEMVIEVPTRLSCIGCNSLI